MIFNPIDIDSWTRKPYFEHYLNHVRCTYSMTADIDITLLRAELKSMGIKLYPALIYMITTVVNRHCEFRTCFDSEGRLGVWDRMSPSFTIFYEEDKTFSSIWTPFSEEFQTFYDRYLQEIETYKNTKQLFPDTNEPPNTFPISSIPWVSFTGFNLIVNTGGTYLLPIFTIGKYHWQDQKVLLPLSVQFHHAVCDGYHAGVLFNELQELAVGCKSWLAGK
ncbi:type A chloramphenicol O-acetyltransferase [Paenibacillus sp. KQZ6P-2]|uniref:Type A chloramphenicol O-acetyltransferase n=1 Tax=Paenibacillus mangrovi TaxID=2931978 RepID=A0A9X1WVY6_9BACL|nr:type A chloramphenicol O-acetyltransferase [Paenibacillus mangrovi]MCJ8014810.1 type A chloramphenicol O-acetyltransferase [Paenibacillus mangrovi]